MAYTTQAHAEQLLPRSYQSGTTVISGARWTAIISETDNIIDGRLGEFYAMNGTGDTPATPGIIQHIAQRIAASKALQELLSAGSLGGALEEVRVEFWDQAIAQLDVISKEPDKWIKPETKTDETVTWGDASPTWTPSSTMALVGITTAGGDPVNIIEDTFRLSANSTVAGGAGFVAADLVQMRNGIDFRIGWNPGYQRYVLEDLSGEISNTAKVTTLKVSYEWIYRRDRGQPQSTRPPVFFVN